MPEIITTKIDRSIINPNVFISIVVPCYNEELVVSETYNRLISVLKGDKSVNFKIIFVNDGSTDKTIDILGDIQTLDPTHVTIINLSRNFGHQISLTAGIDAAEGDAVVIIDADLQDPPEEIIGMISKWRNGADVVYGVRIAREGETYLKRFTAKVFYRLINKFSTMSIPIDTGDFRLMDIKVVEALRCLPEKDRFIRGMVTWTGFKQEPIYYHRASRFAGETKYPTRKMIAFALDGIFSFSMAPLRIASFLGLFISFISAIFVVYIIFARLFLEGWIPGWTLIIVSILFIGGVQLTVLGIIGEYIGRIYGEVKGRPLYFLNTVDRKNKDSKKKVNHND
jgi:polyisoprenyl-phosphate glycosyltransferase